MLVAIGVVGVIDLVLSLKKNKAYFASGVPIFRQELSAQSPNPKPPSAQSMENGVGKTALSRFEFHQLDSDTVGFHEVSTEGSIFRGLVRFSLAGARVEVTGFVDWGVPVVLVIIAVKSFEFHEPLLFVGITGVVALLCMHNAQRCRQVATFALQRWNA